MRIDAVRSALPVFIAALLSTTARAQAPDPPLVTAGVAIAMNCPGANDGIPVLPCTRWGEATPGIHPRGVVDVRPWDRLLLSVTIGTLRVRGSAYEAVGASPAETWLVSRPTRTSWHVAGTGAYVAGAPTHAVRGFVGGGLLAYRDPVRVAVTGPSPLPAWLPVPASRSGIGTVLTGGVLLRGTGRWSGRATYTLASGMADENRSDGGWRHEVALGVQWAVSRRAPARRHARPVVTASGA